MSDIASSQAADAVLSALGEQLAVAGEQFELVVIGGSGLLALGVIERSTRDVDVVALKDGEGLLSADPLPPALIAARDLVTRDFALRDDWLNPGPTGLLDLGLPDGFLDRLEHREYGPALTIYLASRLDQVHFKLYALVDRGPGKHERDLKALSRRPKTSCVPLPPGRGPTTPPRVTRRCSPRFLPISESTMTVAELRDSVQRQLEAFAWDQWAQMGISAAPRRWDPWVADPEALLLLTFEVGRGEPRLLDEVLDWLATNQRLVGVQRLRNLAQDDADRALIEAVLGWLGEQRRRPRFDAKASPSDRPQPFFRGMAVEVAEPDPAFLARGFLRTRPERSHGSQSRTCAGRSTSPSACGRCSVSGHGRK